MGELEQLEDLVGGDLATVLTSLAFHKEVRERMARPRPEINHALGSLLKKMPEDTWSRVQERAQKECDFLFGTVGYLREGAR